VEQVTGGDIKVSIIMPAFNHARWVRQAMESVLAQSFSGFEFIVIDDASSDATWELIQSVREAHSGDLRLHCLRHASNQGAPATINQGLQHAQGEYLTIINSDDVWDAGRLARLLDVAQAAAVDFIATDVALLDADSQPCEAKEVHWTAWFDGLKQDYASHADFLATLLRGNCLITTSNFFFHRRVYAQIGEFAELRYVHDYDFALRVLAAGFSLRFLAGEKLLGYRLHGSNTIREKPLAAIEENMRLLLNWLPCLHETLDERRLHGLQIQLQDLYRYTQEEWLTAVHQRVLAREQELLPLITDRDQWLAQRDGWIAERDQLIGTLQQHVQQHQQWVAERDQWIGERDSIIQQQTALLSDRERWLQDRDGWIAERDSLIRQLQQQQYELRNSRAFRLGESLLSPLRRFRQLFVGDALCLKN
jgi:glycosyltransferase involved in cell wall biosynthesis